MAGNLSIFALHGHVDWLVLTLSMVGLVLFTLLWEHVLHRLDKRVAGSHHAALVSKVYKELSILGFISFTILMVLQFATLPTTEFLLFEFAHVWIFFVALLFVVHACVFLMLSARQKRNWDKINRVSVATLLKEFDTELLVARQEVADLGGAIEGLSSGVAIHSSDRGKGIACGCYPSRACGRSPASQAAGVRRRSACTRFALRLCCPRYPLLKFGHGPRIYYTCCGRGRAIERMEFALIRLLFLHDSKLPNNFDFSKYLRRSLSHAITEQMDVKEETWALLIVVLLLNVCRFAISGGGFNREAIAHAAQGDTMFTMIAGWVVLALDWFLLIETRRAKDRILHAAGCESLLDLPASLRTIAGHSMLRNHAGRRPRFEVQSRAVAEFRRAVDSPGERRKVVEQALAHPRLFVILLEFVMLVQSFSIGLIILLVGSDYFSHAEHGGGWFMFMLDLGPQLVVLFVMQPRVLKNYVFVHAVSRVDATQAEEVLSQQEQSEKLAQALADIIATRLAYKARHMTVARDDRGRRRAILPLIGDAEDSPSPRTPLEAAKSIRRIGRNELDRGGAGAAEQEAANPSQTRRRRSSTILRRGLATQSISTTVAEETATIMEVLFDEINTGTSGAISSDELRTFMKTWQLEVNSREITHLMRLVDTNHTDTIELNEFCDLVLSRTDWGAELASSGTSRRLGSVAELDPGSTNSGVDPATLANCFGGSNVRCSACGQSVLATELSNHAADCLAHRSSRISVTISHSRGNHSRGGVAGSSDSEVTSEQAGSFETVNPMSRR